MPWQANRTTGHAEIDQQHQCIIEHIERMLDAPDGPQQCLAATDVIDVIMQHFRYEEILMEKYPYPGKAEHVREHAAIARWTDKLREDLASGNIHHDVLQRFLYDWAQHHIGRCDRRLAAYLDGRC